jgi:hypothetical protein
VKNAGAFGAPAVRLQPASRPCLVGSANGLRGLAHAMDLLTQGTDTLDAAIEVVKIPELDPNDQSVTASAHVNVSHGASRTASTDRSAELAFREYSESNRKHDVEQFSRAGSLRAEKTKIARFSYLPV